MLCSTCRQINGKSSSKRWPSKCVVSGGLALTNILYSATPVPFGRGRGKPLNVPDHPPPPGYLCYRCREKGLSPPDSPQEMCLFLPAGHWIQACPTNNDPKFDGKYRVKRSTGIPRSLQTKVDKPDSLLQDGPTEEMKNTGVMVNADGDFVIAKPDKAAWELYQEKAKASAAAAAEAAAAENSRELQARGLECPIDKRMFLEPTKTPCCQRTYCNDCISNALIESDFVCPGCSAEGVLLDNLTPNEKAVADIKVFEADKAESKKEKEKQAASQESRPDHEDGEPAQAESDAVKQEPSDTPGEDVPVQSKKRPLEDETADTETGDSESASTAKKQKAEGTPETQDAQNKGPSTSFPPPQMPFGPGFMPPQGVPGMPFPDPGFMNGGMGPMNPMGGPANGLMNNNMDQAWNPMNFMNFNPLQSGMYGDQAGGAMSNGYGMPNMYNMMPMGPMPQPMPPTSGFEQGPEMGGFSNQQRTAFSTPYAREEDSPYFRQPVNPQRHQAKNRRIRPSDYREL